MKTRSFLLAAGIALALAFTFSCDSGGGGGGGTQGGGGSSSSGGPGPGGGNSSSGGGGSSSSNGGGGGYTGPYGSVSHGGKTYKTVVIGTQTWMAENLNYDPGTGNSACYDDQASKCATYGRLYDWETAIEVFPSGWHLPSDDEWTVLTDYVGGSSGAGTKLKSTSGWKSILGTSGNGTDNYGFSALPGSFGSSDGSFSGVGSVGDTGSWWSASENEYGGADSRSMSYMSSNVGWNFINKSSLYSVRCVQD
jgi:uncharacterized protein (TIGR02145 family)